ncbi:MAG: endonuclease domain-containing protein [Rhizobiales bacterium]|nr:endonuclease domain-containing protein [Hyphomicrobiales bacterium]
MVTQTIRRARARRLRQDTTPHERMMWRAFKTLPVIGTHFRRQAPIGSYIVDFFCPALHLVIEIDGGHHSETGTAHHDLIRQQWLEAEGYRVLRFWNSDVATNMEGILQAIAEVAGFEDAGSIRLKHSRHERPKASTPPRPPRTTLSVARLGRPSPSRGG